MENEQGSGVFKGFVSVVLVLLLVCAGICTYKYVKGEIPGVTQNSTTEEFIESEMQAVPTVEEAMQEWNDLKESSRCHEVYSNFPPEIMQALFEKLGTQEPVKKYVYEYERNREYYISLQIAEQLKHQGLNNPGVDGKRIEGVEITTKLKKEKEPEKVPIPAKAAKDTIVYQ